MKRKLALSLAIATAATSIGSTAAWADDWRHRGPYGPYAPPEHRHHHHGPGAGWWVPGLVVGSALLWVATRPPPIVYREPPSAVLVPAPVIVPQPDANQWWYYCRSAGAYYPYVSTCPTGWEPVPARP